VGSRAQSHRYGVVTRDSGTEKQSWSLNPISNSRETSQSLTSMFRHVVDVLYGRQLRRIQETVTKTDTEKTEPSTAQTLFRQSVLHVS